MRCPHFCSTRKGEIALLILKLQLKHYSCHSLSAMLVTLFRLEGLIFHIKNLIGDALLEKMK